MLFRSVMKEHGSVFAIADRFPVTEGHLLIVPRAHKTDWFELSDQERKDAIELIDLLKNESSAKDFNIGMNCGAAAGQTIFHCHIHFISRREGDHPDPRGGVRGVIPEKQSY